MIIWAEIQSKSVEQSKWPNISQKLLPAPTKLSRRWPWLEMRGIIQRSDGWWWWGPTLARGRNLIMVDDRLLDYCLTAGTTKPTNTSAFLCFGETLCILHGRWTGSSESGVRGESRQTPWRPSNPTCPPYHPAHSFWGGIYRFKEGKLKFMLTNTQTLCYRCHHFVSETVGNWDSGAAKDYFCPMPDSSDAISRPASTLWQLNGNQALKQILKAFHQSFCTAGTFVLVLYNSYLGFLVITYSAQ